MVKPKAPYWVRIRSVRMKPRSRMKFLSCKCCTAFNNIHYKREALRNKEMQEEINGV